LWEDAINDPQVLKVDADTDYVRVTVIDVVKTKAFFQRNKAILVGFKPKSLTTLADMEDACKSMDSGRHDHRAITENYSDIGGNAFRRVAPLGSSSGSAMPAAIMDEGMKAAAPEFLVAPEQGAGQFPFSALPVAPLADARLRV
jgi:hypothetical protein